MLKCIEIIAAVMAIVLSPAQGQTTKTEPTAAPQSNLNASAKPKEQSDRNALLADAASINEDLIGFALDGETAKVADKVLAMRGALPALRPLLDDGTFEVLTRHASAMERALAKKNVLASALAAVEAYRTIENAIEASSRSAPIGVAMLDYSGFKLSLLAATREPDWARIRAGVKELREFWSALVGSIEDKRMRNLFTVIQDGLKSAAERKAINGVKFAAKVQLEAVDVLEQYFKGNYKQ